ncbi:C40 family peptidase, partial [Candidatus Wolfebacteria bacterium]|nr:C40 family peptidase [Candidatus Wolfebacteria bacterium]
KGWDHKQSLYVSSNNIFDGYNYWNNKLRTIAFGAGLDCSGLVEWAFNRSFDPRKSLLLNVIRYDGADGQYQNNTETVTENNLQPGDLLFLDKDNDNYIDHVAMYVGESGGYNIMEAYSPAEGIVPANKTEFKTRTGFDQNKHIRRVAISPSLGGQVKAGSPIDLIVTDPEGFTITPTTAIQTDNEYLREIPRELYYAEGEIGSDGKPKDIVYWPKQKIGDYVVKVLPETGVSLIETYSLEFTSGDQTTIFAENIPLSQIPSEGYGVVVEENGSINPFIPISIDIKPDSLPNSINIGSGGIVPVAIFGTATFNVAQINLATITLANAPIKPKKNGQLIASYSDVNEDGFTDVVVHIITEALQLTSLDVKAELNGSLLDGSKIKGSDSVRIVP